MKNNFLKKFLIGFCLIFIFNSSYVFGEEDVSKLNIDTQVDVPQTCVVLDTDNVEHSYSSESYLGICAIKAALDIQSILSVKLSNKYPEMGLFITAINGIEAKPDSEYWALYKNGGYAEVGLSSLSILSGDFISLKLSDFSGIETGDSVKIRVNSLISNTPSHSHGSSGSYITRLIPVEKKFNTENALKFLEQNQKSDGSFGDPLYTDWATIAVTAGESQSIKEKLIKYYTENNLESNLATDNERRAMALMALGIDPYTGAKINYIKKIIDSFDGEQFGDKDLYNDDIFALIVLKNAGYTSSDEIIAKDIKYLISKQTQDGSWGSIDMTAVYIEAMKNFEDIDGVKDSVLKSKKFIISQQKPDGGFDNPSSTAWVLQILSSDDQILKAENYLTTKQESDGGIGSLNENIESRIWATSYVVPAILHKSWGDIMQKFSKQEFIEQNKTTEATGVDISVRKWKKEKNSNQDSSASQKKIEKMGILQNTIKTEVSKPSFWKSLKRQFSWLLDKFSF